MGQEIKYNGDNTDGMRSLLETYGDDTPFQLMHGDIAFDVPKGAVLRMLNSYDANRKDQLNNTPDWVLEGNHDHRRRGAFIVIDRNDGLVEIYICTEQEQADGVLFAPSRGSLDC